MKKLRGSMTIEAAVIVPVILMVFALTVTILFYYHDKNVVAAIAHETVVWGCSQEEVTEEEVEQYFRGRLQKKLLWFSNILIDVQLEKEGIQMVCTSRRKGLSMRVEMSSVRTEPEQYVRNLKRLEKIGEEIGGID